MDTETVRRAFVAIERRDWERLTPLLHPYLHWTCLDGRVIRGRNNVLAYLKTAQLRRLPAQHELRDGQIYRWASGK